MSDEAGVKVLRIVTCIAVFSATLHLALEADSFSDAVAIFVLAIWSINGLVADH